MCHWMSAEGQMYTASQIISILGCGDMRPLLNDTLCSVEAAADSAPMIMFQPSFMGSAIDFHPIFTLREILSFFNHAFKKCKNHSCSQAVQKQWASLA